MKNQWQNETIDLTFRGIDVVRPATKVPNEGYFRRAMNAVSRIEGSIGQRDGVIVYNSGGPSVVSPVSDITSLDFAGTIKKVVVAKQNNSYSMPISLVKAQPIRRNDTAWAYGFGLLKIAIDDGSGNFATNGSSAPALRNANVKVVHSATHSVYRYDYVGIKPPHEINDTIAGSSTITTLMHCPLPELIEVTSGNGWLAPANGSSQMTTSTFSSKDFTLSVANENINIKKPSKNTFPSTSGNNVLKCSVITTATEGTAPAPKSIGRIFSSTKDLKNTFSGASLVECYFAVSRPASVREIRFELSLETPTTISNVTTSGSELIVTATDHKLSKGEEVVIDGVGGATGANGTFILTSASTNTFMITSTIGGAYTSGGKVVSFGRNYFQKVVKPLPQAQMNEPSGETAGMTYQEALERYIEQWELEDRLNDVPVQYRKYIIDQFRRGRENIEQSFKKAMDTSAGMVGRFQWEAFSYKKNSFLRIGTDFDKDWSTVTACRVVILYDSTVKAGEEFWLSEWNVIPAESELSTGTGIPYDWRFTYYDKRTGVESNPSPAQPEGVLVNGQQAMIRLPQYSKYNYRIYRRGGLLSQYHLVDELGADGTTTSVAISGGYYLYYDRKSDFTIATNKILEFDNDQPCTGARLRKNYVRSATNIGDPVVWKTSNSIVTPNDAEAPDGSGSAARIEATANNAYVYQVLQDYVSDYNNGALINGASLTFYLKRVSGSGIVYIYFNNAKTPPASPPTSLYRTTCLLSHASEGYDDGIWERFVLHIGKPAGGVTDVNIGIMLGTSGDEVLAWGAQVMDDNADSTPVSMLIDSANAPASGSYVPETGLIPYSVFGPVYGKYLFACNIRNYDDDLVHGGDLFWCKPHNPDSWPARNRIRITSPGDPLVNGCIYNGRAYVFSKERLYAVSPNPAGGSTFISQPTPCGAGLWHPKGIAVADRIYFISRTGIMATTGGREENITDNSFVRPLFREISVNSQFDIDMDYEHDYVDWSKDMALEYHEPYIVFTYYGKDTGKTAVLKYHIYMQRWEYMRIDANPDGGAANEFIALYSDPYDGKLYYGDNRGYLYYEDDSVQLDAASSAPPWRLMTGFMNQGHPEKDKIYGQVIAEAYVPAHDTIDVLYATSSVDTTASYTTLSQLVNNTSNAKTIRKIMPFNGGNGIEARHIALDFRRTPSISPLQTESHRLKHVELSYRLRDTERTKLSTDWDNLGVLEDKYIWGMTLNTTFTTTGTRSLVVQYDGGVTTKTHSVPIDSGRQTTEVTWPPVRANEVRARLATTDDYVLNDFKWHHYREPDQLKKWYSGWHAPTDKPTDLYIWGLELDCDTKGSTKSVAININGLATTQTTGSINTTNRAKQRITFAPVKAQTVKFEATDNNPGFLYAYKWLHSGEEAPEIAYFDSNVQELGNGKDFFCWGAELDLQCLNSKTVEVNIIKDETTTQSTTTYNNSTRQLRRFSVPTFKAKSLRLIVKHSGTGSINEAFRLYNFRWLRGNDQPPAVTHWDTDFEGVEAGDMYVYGIELDCDTLGSTKTITIHKEDDTVIHTGTITTTKRAKKRFTWLPIDRPNQLRMKSTATTGRLYGWTWLATKEPPLLDNYDSNWMVANPSGDFYCTGLELDIDTLNQDVTCKIYKEGRTTTASVTRLVNSTPGRNRIRATFPAIRSNNFRYTLSGKPFRNYTPNTPNIWIGSKDEPPIMTDWDSNYESDGSLEDKWISGLYLDIDTSNSTKSFTILIDGATYSTGSVRANGRRLERISFGPVKGTMMRYVSTQTVARIWRHRWIWEKEPTQLTNMATNWDDLNWPYEKLIKGVSITADTQNTTKTIQLRTDGNDSAIPTDIDGNSVSTFTMRFNGKASDEFSFPAMIRAHTVRLDPTDSNLGRLYSVQWIFDREPPALSYWYTQEHTFNIQDYLFLIDAQITIRSTNSVTMVVDAEGTKSTYSIATTNGERRKKRVTFNALKGKSFRFTLSASNAFQVYNEDTEITVRPFKSGEERTLKLPFSGGTQNP